MLLALTSLQKPQDVIDTEAPRTDDRPRLLLLAGLAEQMQIAVRQHTPAPLS